MLCAPPWPLCHSLSLVLHADPDCLPVLAVTPQLCLILLASAAPPLITFLTALFHEPQMCPPPFTEPSNDSYLHTHTLATHNSPATPPRPFSPQPSAERVLRQPVSPSEPPTPPSPRWSAVSGPPHPSLSLGKTDGKRTPAVIFPSPSLAHCHFHFFLYQQTVFHSSSVLVRGKELYCIMSYK